MHCIISSLLPPPLTTQTTMHFVAFTTPVVLRFAAKCSSFTPHKPLSARNASPAARVSMAISPTADLFQNRSQTREAKQSAASTGVYTVQCTEATAGANSAEYSRLCSLARSFRLRQSSASARYADLFATRRAAVIAAAGSHVQESYAVRFPARAAATVASRAEKLRACSRYIDAADKAEQYMFQCVENQYTALKVPGGVFSVQTGTARQAGDVDTARVSAAATEFRSNQLTKSQKTQQRYNASLQAIYSGRGCAYEEDEYVKFPKMAGAIRWSTGAYAASVTSVAGAMNVRVPSVTERIEGVNRDSFWPSYNMREAVARKHPFWKAPSVKSYSPMSEAALQFGIEAQTNKPQLPSYNGWKPGWKPKSSIKLSPYED